MMRRATATGASGSYHNTSIIADDSSAAPWNKPKATIIVAVAANKRSRGWMTLWSALLTVWNWLPTVHI
jgi:hypothetical protein